MAYLKNASLAPGLKVPNNEMAGDRGYTRQDNSCGAEGDRGVNGATPNSLLIRGNYTANMLNRPEVSADQRSALEFGSAPRVAGELFKMVTGVNLVHVPYRGSAPALIDMIGGQVQVMFDTVPSSIEYIKAGKLRSAICPM
jgi:Tripartite tricarboxylate transporter family receptor